LCSGIEVQSVLLQGQGSAAPCTTAAERCKDWDVRQATGFVGLSGAYDIPGLVEHLNDRGLHRALFERIMAQPKLEAMDVVSPLHVIADCGRCERRCLPCQDL
jgi:hypothetical protein